MQQYIGLFVIIRQTRNRAWVIKDPDGIVHIRTVAAYWIVPYIAKGNRMLAELAEPDPDLEEELLDEIMEEADELGPDEDLISIGA